MRREALGVKKPKATQTTGSSIFAVKASGVGKVLLHLTPHASGRSNGGGERDRTDDLLRARQALSQLSYTPIRKKAERDQFEEIWFLSFLTSLLTPHASRRSMVGLGGLEPPTSRLSGVRSNQLSYRPPFNCCFGFYTSSLCKPSVLDVFVYVCGTRFPHSSSKIKTSS